MFQRQAAELAWPREVRAFDMGVGVLWRRTNHAMHRACCARHSPIVVCDRVGTTLHFVDPQTLQGTPTRHSGYVAMAWELK